MKKLIQTLLLSGALATAGGMALAQPDGMMSHDGMHRGNPARMAQMHAKHLSELKTKLNISSGQENAWNTFAETMKPSHEMGLSKRPDPAELDKLATPERIDKMRALQKEHMAAMEAAMDKRADATKTFYATLSPEQKKVFDAEFAKMAQRGNHGHKMGPGHDQAVPPQKQ